MTTTNVQVLKFTKAEDPKILAMTAVVRARDKAIEKQLAFGAPMGNKNAARAHAALAVSGSKEEVDKKYDKKVKDINKKYDEAIKRADDPAIQKDNTPAELEEYRKGWNTWKEQSLAKAERDLKGNTEKTKEAIEREAGPKPVEAEAAAKEMGINADYSKLSIEQANMINGTVGSTIKDFPAVKDNIKAIDTNVMVAGGGRNGSSKSDSLGTYYDGEKRIAVGAHFDQEEQNREVGINFHPEGCTSQKSIVDHEIGHALDKTYGISHYDAYAKELGDKNWEAKAEFNTLWKESKKGDMGSLLSKYAASDKKEFLAEGWSEYKNNPNPRETATKIGKIIESFKGK